MATEQATLDQPLDAAKTATRSAAAAQGYALAEGASGGNVLVFKRGVSAFSWGSQLTIEFDQVSPTETRLTVTTGETFAITDWGRGKRAAHKLFDTLGATY